MSLKLINVLGGTKHKIISTTDGTNEGLITNIRAVNRGVGVQSFRLFANNIEVMETIVSAGNTNIITTPINTPMNTEMTITTDSHLSALVNIDMK